MTRPEPRRPAWIYALCSLAGCAAPLRALPAADAAPLRHALGVAAPWTHHRVDGVDLAVHDSDPGGARPTLLCLHAIGHGGGDYAGVAAALERDFRVITVDWPGQGWSGPDPVPASALRYAALLEGLVEALRLERVVLIGNSIGGAAAIRYAAAHPERVRALVLANPGGLDPGGALAKLYIGFVVGRFERGVRGEARYAAWFRDYYAGVLPSPEAAARREAIVAAGCESAPILVQAWRSFAAPEAFLGPLLPRLRMPVLLPWARRDRIVSWSRSAAAVARIPGARVVQLDAGHSAFLERPAEFLETLRPFLAQLP